MLRPPLPGWICRNIGWLLVGLFFTTVDLGAARAQDSVVDAGSARFLAPPENSLPDDRFGNVLTVVGDDTLAITSRADDTSAADSGAIYLYDFDGNFKNVVLESPNPEAGVQASAFGAFGEHVAAVGDDKIVVSARHENGTAGRAYLFDLNGEVLTTFEAPVPSAGAEFSGRSILGKEDVVFIGSWNPPIDLGFVTIAGRGEGFLFDLEGNVVTTFRAPGGNDTDSCLGRSAAWVGDDMILIGDRCADIQQGGGIVKDAGAAYLFDLEGNLVQSFPNPEPDVEDLFGTSVAYADDRVLIGSVWDDNPDNGISAGAAYIFELDGTQVARVDDPEPFDRGLGFIEQNWFGFSAGSIDDELFVVGALKHSNSEIVDAGKLYILDSDGNILQSLTSPDPGDDQHFGDSFAKVGDEFWVGEAYAGGGFENGGIGGVWRYDLLEDASGLPGDFDASGSVDLADLDLLCSGLAAGGSDLDLTGDGAVNNDDLQAFLDLTSSLSGDADLSGSVDFADFLALSGNISQSGTWSQGDFDCDGSVAFGDFLLLSNNFGQVAAVAAVPEPSSGLLAWGILVYFGGFFRGRRDS